MRSKAVNEARAMKPVQYDSIDTLIFSQTRQESRETPPSASFSVRLLAQRRRAETLNSGVCSAALKELPTALKAGVRGRLSCTIIFVNICPFGKRRN
jgi:hypothetical protein